MSLFFIDNNIAKAKTISTDFYTDPVFFGESKEKIFNNTWQFIGDKNSIKESGQCHPLILLEKYLDEPLVLTKDKENVIHCLSNVCTHRGTIVVNGPCKISKLRCRYHGRNFHLNGKFMSMPEFAEVENFPSPDDDLKELPLFEWGSLLFTSLGNAFPQNVFFDDMVNRLSWLPLDEFVYRGDLSREYTVNSHWALYCENYLEGLHIPFVHASLNAVIDFGNYSTELYRYGSLQLGIAKQDEHSFDLPLSSPDYGKKVAAYYFWIFPNMMFNFYPWGLSINHIQPVSLNKSRVSFITYVWKEDKLNTGAGSGLDRVEREDEEVVEAVQRGIQSRFYKHGRYSVTREQGTHHFHQLLAEFIQ
ncbi:MAG: aromatic ring-hydroxylating dioxygenase subunit alpha [Bacteroidota bacterium]